jgi:hypothetical protein
MNVLARHEFDGPAGSMQVEIFRRGKVYYSRDRDVIDIGKVSVDIGLAPSLMLGDDSRWLRRELPRLPPLPPRADRRELIRVALERFRSAQVQIGSSGQTADQFRELLRRACGLPWQLIDDWIDLLEGSLNRLPEGNRGGIELISLPANTFVCLEAWLAALMRSDAVWIRPSRREPFCAQRLLTCLLEAGWPAERLGLYPTRHEGLVTSVAIADRAVVFGGSELPSSLYRRNDVDVRGPGRTRAVVGETFDLERVSRILVRQIASQSGRFCTNVGTILCAGDVDLLGRSIATGLDRIVVGPVPDRSYPQAMHTSRGEGQGHADWLNSRIRDDDVKLTSRPILVAEGDAVYLAPTLIKLGRAEGHPLIGMELPFPVACIAEVPEARQSSLCGDAGFVYLIGDRSGLGTLNLPGHVSITTIDPATDQP